jgi:hypothetical protein
MRVSPTTSVPGSFWASDHHLHRNASRPRSVWGRSRRLFGSVLALASVAGVGCRTDPQPVVRIDAVDEAQAFDRGIERSRLEQEAKRTLGAWNDFAFRLAKKDEPPWSLTVTVMLFEERDRFDDGQGAQTRTLGLRLRLGRMKRSPSDVGALPETVEVDSLTTAKNTDLSDVIRMGVGEGMSRLRRFVELYRAPVETVLAAIRSKDPLVQAQGLMVAEHRTLAEAVSAVSAILEDPESSGDVTLRAIGAAVAIRDPQLVPSMIAAAHGRSDPFLAQLLFALARIGGREAEAYLFTIKAGHPNPALRQQAAQALFELSDPVPAEP